MRCIILGAGISGLSLAWFLKRRFGSSLNMTLLDQSRRAGGWIHSTFQQGFLFEQGPHSLRSGNGALETWQLIEQLELQDQIIGADPSAHCRFLWTRGALHVVPSGILSVLSSPLTRGMVGAFLKECLISKSREDQEESIASFFSRRFGSKITAQFIDPMVSGIFAGDPQKLSMPACFPTLHSWEKTYGSLLRASFFQKKSVSKFPLFSFKRGLQTLIDTLAQRLEDHLRLEVRVKALRFFSHGVEVGLENGENLIADHLFCTLPAFRLAPYFENIHEGMASLLRSIESVSVASVNVGYHRPLLKKKGFGYLIPNQEKEQVLGVIFDSAVFPQQNQIPEETRLSVLMGGAQGLDVLSLDTEGLKEVALNSLSRHLGIEAYPDALSVQVMKQAIPQYHLGHPSKIEKIHAILDQHFPHLTLTGNSFEGVSVNECISKSMRIVQVLIRNYP